MSTVKEDATSGSSSMDPAHHCTKFFQSTETPPANITPDSITTKITDVNIVATDEALIVPNAAITDQVLVTMDKINNRSCLASDITTGAETNAASTSIEKAIEASINTSIVTNNMGVAAATRDIAQATSDTAQATTDTAQATMDTAQATTDTAQATTDTAQATTDTAEATTDTAQATTDTAQATTDTAQATADTAQATVDTARATADTAQATVDTARATADIAQATTDTSQATMVSAQVATKRVGSCTDMTIASKDSTKISSDLTTGTSNTASNTLTVIVPTITDKSLAITGIQSTIMDAMDVEDITTYSAQTITNTSQATIHTSESTMDTHQATMDTHQATIDTHQATIDTHQATIDTHQATIDTHQATIDTHQATIDTHKATTDTAQATTDTAQATTYMAQATTYTAQATTYTTQAATDTTQATTDTTQATTYTTQATADMTQDIMDMTQATTDMTQATTDTTQATMDTTQATADTTQATTDTTQATMDTTQATTDTTQATTDTIQATTDATQATTVTHQRERVAVVRERAPADTAPITIPSTALTITASFSPQSPADVHTSLFPTNIHHTPQTNFTPMEDDAMECLGSPTPKKERTSTSNALLLLTGYGMSDSEDDCDVDDSMDTNCDNDTNEVETMKATEDCTTNLSLEFLVESTVPTLSQQPLPKVNGDDCIIVDVLEQNINSRAGTVESGSDTPEISITEPSSYRYVIDVGSDSEDSESGSSSSSSPSSSSSSVDSWSSADESEDSSKDSKREKITSHIEKCDVQRKRSSGRKLLTAGELLLEDLPPIDDLHISVPEEKANPIGLIFNIVGQQVVVAAFTNIPPIDLDTVLFLDHGQRTLGHVFDVFGPVQEPFYVVRFNSAEHVKDHKIDKGDLVYFAPSTEHTNYIVVNDLMRMRGTDASGMAGNELPVSEGQDFSDDEEEARILSGDKQNKYTSTNEFQPQTKRGRGQGHVQFCGRGYSNENGNVNPFGRRIMVSRGCTRFGHPPTIHPRFRPHGPPSFPMSHPDYNQCSPNFQRPPRMPRNPGVFEPRSFSNFQNQVQIAGNQGMALISNKADGYHNSPSSGAAAWPQPPHYQFGGPPQFNSTSEHFSHGISGLPCPPPSSLEKSYGLGSPLRCYDEVMQSSGVECVSDLSRGWYPQHDVAHPMPLASERYTPSASAHSMLPPPPPDNLCQTHPNVSLPHCIQQPQSMLLPPPPAHSMPPLPPPAHSMPLPPPPHSMPPPPPPQPSMTPPHRMLPPPSPHTITPPPPPHSMTPPPHSVLLPPPPHSMTLPPHSMTLPPPHSMSPLPPSLYNMTQPHNMPPPSLVPHLPPSHHATPPPPLHVQFDLTRAPPPIPPASY